LELTKKKYAQNEVVEIMKAYKGEYEKKLTEQQETILRLTEEVRILKEKSEEIEKKKEIILATLIRAEQTANDLKEKSELQYKLEIEKLKEFTVRWNGYFEELKEKYPMYAPVKKALEIKGKIDKISSKDKPKEVIGKLESSIPKEVAGDNFNPKRKIRDYIAATGDNGFNLDEVLNPGELQLEDICKELGLLDGNE
jgi:hypothetical protein